MTSEILSICFLLFSGSLLLYYGAEWLVDNAAHLALSSGLSPLTVGLTVIAFGTSMPELAVSMRAAISGSADLVTGNIIGSNISNIALILGLSSLAYPLAVKDRVIRIETPIMIGISVVVGLLCMTGPITQLKGVLFFLGIIFYTAFNYLFIEKTLEKKSSPPQIKKNILKNLLMIALGIATLVAGGELFVQGATDTAILFGISESVIGLSLVAIGTSLPELATALMATYKGETDLVIGNVVGSNIFNLLCVLGAVAIVTPVDTSGVHPLDIAMMIGLSLALLPVLRSGQKIERSEGAFLLILYTAYLAWLYTSR